MEAKKENLRVFENENNAEKELINFLEQRVEALRLENLRLMSENDRLVNSIHEIYAKIRLNGRGL